MPTATIELPRDMVDAATSYAARENKSVEDLFFNWLHRSYGFQRMYVTADAEAKTIPAKRSIPQDETDPTDAVSRPANVRDNDSSWLEELHPKVRRLVGALKLPPEDASKSYDELRDEYFAEKYGVFL